MILMVDASSSNLFGSNYKYKKDLLVEICAVLAFSAMQNNDKVGVLFFTDRNELYIPPKKR